MTDEALARYRQATAEVHRLESRLAQLHQERADALRDLADQGLSVRQIAELVGDIRYGQVHKLIHR